jgi:predicted DNA-binding protein (MmcQ/YjbR family)
LISSQTFRKLALAFPGVEEQPHFIRTSFRVKKKIFATLHEKEMQAVVKLSPVDQSVFTDLSNGAVSPVKGTWGRMGYTCIDLKRAPKNLIADALVASYNLVQQKKNRKRK